MNIQSRIQSPVELLLWSFFEKIVTIFATKFNRRCSTGL